MQSEGPYTAVAYVDIPDSYAVQLNGRRVAVCNSIETAERWVTMLNKAHSDGRKAERERCAEICGQNATCEGIAQKIKEQILGGQDGK